MFIDPTTKKATPIDLEENYREAELASIVMNSPQAKEHIRKAFGIPNLPPPREIEEIEATRKKKRKGPKGEEPASPKQVSLIE